MLLQLPPFKCEKLSFFIRIDILKTLKKLHILRNSFFVYSFDICVFLNSTFWPLKQLISIWLFPKCVRVFPDFIFVDFTGLSVRIFHLLLKLMVRLGQNNYDPCQTLYPTSLSFIVLCHSPSSFFGHCVGKVDNFTNIKNYFIF